MPHRLTPQRMAILDFLEGMQDQCRACGLVADIFREFRIPLSGEESESFLIESTHVQFTGLCLQRRRIEVNKMASKW